MAKLFNIEMINIASREMGIIMPNPWKGKIKVSKYIKDIKREERRIRNGIPKNLCDSINLSGLINDDKNGKVILIREDVPIWESVCKKAGDIRDIKCVVLDMHEKHADTSDDYFSIFEVNASLAGFHRADARMRKGRACIIFLKKPVITMTSIGVNGRWGNQLIQYLWLKAVADKKKAIVQSPVWFGSILFGIADTPPAEKILWRSHACDNWECTVPFFKSESKLTENIDFWGWYQWGFSEWAGAWRDRAKAMFTLVPEIKLEIKLILEKLNNESKRFASCHLRRGDYYNNHTSMGCGSGIYRWVFYPTPFKWHDRWISKNTKDVSLIYIASEDSALIENKPWSVPTISVRKISHLPPSSDWIVDFEILRKSKILCMSNSTFSYMAGWLGSSELTVRPSLKKMNMVTESFDSRNHVLEFPDINESIAKRLQEEDM